MNCPEIIAVLPDYIRRRLPIEQATAVRAHLSACLDCATAYEDELAFGALLHGTDEPAPPQVLTRVMAEVRAEPRQLPVFRVRLLDFALAFALTAIVGGLTIAVLSLRAISPVLTRTLDLGSLFGGELTVRTIVIAALWALVGLSVSVPIAAVMHLVFGKAPHSVADIR